MMRAWFATRMPSSGPGAGRERAAHPERAFIQMRQKFGTDDAAEERDKAPKASKKRTRRR